MDIEQARTFLTIAANGSFQEAARQLHLTQSTVSARIQRLEADLEARLFVRNRSGRSSSNRKPAAVASSTTSSRPVRT